MANGDDGVPTLVFVMPEQSWQYMQNGLGHEFDLTNVGIPLRVVIGRTATHETGMADLERANGGSLKKARDVRHIDMHFGKKPDQ